MIKLIMHAKCKLLVLIIGVTFFASLFLVPFNFTLCCINVLILWLNIFKLFLILSGAQLNQSKLMDSEVEVAECDWPCYSILLPLYNEANIIAKLFYRINNIDYPKEKLEVLLVLESNDHSTLEAINKISHNFRIIIVPESFPKTKGKACNYATNFINGTYVTIYDAEDFPDRLQLKKIVQQFSNLDDDYVAIQARLNYYNNGHNLLTKLFSLEYSSQFDFMLPALEHWECFVPLGGSSNHLKVDKMKQIGWWDSYNVTEDIDLAVKIYKSGYKIAYSNSITWEQSPTSIKAWIKQRSRWIKGFLQTFIFNMNHPWNFAKMANWRRLISFSGMTIMPIFSYLYIPLMFLPFLNVGLNSLILALSYGNFAFAMIVVLISTKYAIAKYKWNKHWRALPFIAVYWFLYFLATLKALYELFSKPCYWDKTEHY